MMAAPDPRNIRVMGLRDVVSPILAQGRSCGLWWGCLMAGRLSRTGTTRTSPPGLEGGATGSQTTTAIAAPLGDKLLRWGKTWENIRVRRNKAVLKVPKALAGIRMGGARMSTLSMCLKTGGA